MKETCCWELSGLELSPPAAAGSEATVSQYKRWNFLSHLSSSLPASCCTQERFNGLEEKPSAYCHRTWKPGPSPKQETENLSCESKRTNWPDYWSVGRGQLFSQLDCALLGTAGRRSTAAAGGNCSAGSSRRAKHGTTPTAPHKGAARRQGQGSWGLVRKKPARHL